MANPDKATDWKWLITILLAAGILGTMIWQIRDESAKLAMQADGADRRMARVETAIHVLAGAQDEKIRRLVDQSLTVSQDPAASAAEALSGAKDDLQKNDFPHAAETIRSARTLLLTAKGLKTAVAPGYFTNALAVLDDMHTVSDPEIAQDLFFTRVALAEYHSVLEVAPELPNKVVPLQVRTGQAVERGMLASGIVYRPNAQLTLPKDANFQAKDAVLNGTDLPVDADAFVREDTYPGRVTAVVGGLTFDGAAQTLDGVTWKNVAFVNARIHYRGGRTSLDHVRFINCSFDVPQNDAGARFTAYVVSGADTLSIN